MIEDNTHIEFLQILRQCQGILLKVCLYFTRRQREEMEDLYQDITLALWKAWPEFKGHSKPSTWAYRIALNVAVSHKRSTQRRPQIVALDESCYDLLVEEATDVRFQRLYQLIDQLELEDRRLIFLYLDRISAKEIAEITGLTEANVRQKIHRIKNKLITLNQHKNE